MGKFQGNHLHSMHRAPVDEPKMWQSRASARLSAPCIQVGRSMQ